MQEPGRELPLGVKPPSGVEAQPEPGEKEQSFQLVAGQPNTTMASLVSKLPSPPIPMQWQPGVAELQPNDPRTSQVSVHNDYMYRSAGLALMAFRNSPHIGVGHPMAMVQGYLEAMAQQNTAEMKPQANATIMAQANHRPMVPLNQETLIPGNLEAVVQRYNETIALREAGVAFQRDLGSIMGNSETLVPRTTEGVMPQQQSLSADQSRTAEVLMQTNSEIPTSRPNETRQVRNVEMLDNRASEVATPQGNHEELQARHTHPILQGASVSEVVTQRNNELISQATLEAQQQQHQQQQQQHSDPGVHVQGNSNSIQKARARIPAQGNGENLGQGSSGTITENSKLIAAGNVKQEPNGTNRSDCQGRKVNTAGGLSDKDIEDVIHDILGQRDGHPFVSRVGAVGPNPKIPRQHKCAECAYETDNRSHLKRHVNTVHCSFKPYQCYVCFKEYSRTEKLKAHFKKLHPHDVYNIALARKNQSDVPGAGDMNRNPNNVGMAAAQAGAVDAMNHSRVKVERSGADGSFPALASHLGNSERRFKCLGCTYIGKDSWHLKRHISDVHEKTKEFKCPKCNYGSSRKHRMVSHMKGHGVLCCLYCPYESYDLAQYGQHLQFCSKMQKGQSHQCRLCLDNFTTKKAFAKHMTEAHGLSMGMERGAANVDQVGPSNSAASQTVQEAVALVAQVAQKVNNLENPSMAMSKAKELKYEQSTPQQLFNSTSKLNLLSKAMTMSLTNTTPPPSEGKEQVKLKCPQCTYMAKDGWYLRRHISDVHSGRKDFDCPNCEYATSRRDRLLKHMKIHKDPGCLYCDYRGTDYKDFRTHLQRCTEQHKGRTLTCDLCSEPMNSWKAYKLHKEKMHHGAVYQCKSCSFATTDLSTWEFHKLCHSSAPDASTDEYFCAECNELFPSSGMLKHHVKEVHHGNQRQPVEAKTNTNELGCSLCSYTTIHAHVMDNHMRFHRGDPLLCTVAGCNFQTMWRNSLRVHQQHIHGLTGQALDCGDVTFPIIRKPMVPRTEISMDQLEQMPGVSRTTSGQAVVTHDMLNIRKSTLHQADLGTSSQLEPAVSVTHSIAAAISTCSPNIPLLSKSTMSLPTTCAAQVKLDGAENVPQYAMSNNSPAVTVDTSEINISKAHHIQHV